MDFSKYKSVRFNWYAISDAVLIASFIFFALAKEKEKTDYLIIAVIVFILAWVIFVYQAVAGYTIVKNKSNSKLKVLPEKDELNVYTVNDYAENIDGFSIVKNKSLYKLGDGVHATVKENYDVSMNSIFFAHFANFFNGGGKITMQKFSGNDYDTKKWGKLLE